MGYSATAREAILSGGLPGLLTASGGSFKVGLFLNGVEISGNGYARRTISTLGSPSSDSNGSAILGTTTFTPSGGSFVFDSIKVFASDGTTLQVQSATIPNQTSPGNPITVPNGDVLAMTISFSVPSTSDSRIATLESTASTLTSDVATLETAVAARRIVKTVDIMHDLGCVPDDYADATATANATKINNALAAIWSGGSLTLADGSQVAVTDGLTAPGREFFYKGVLIVPKKVGGFFRGAGHGYLLGTDDFNDSGDIGGAITRLTRIDGASNSFCVLMRGANFVFEKMQISGQRMSTYGTPLGTRTGICVGIEGNDPPSTGKHVFRDFCVANSTIGFCHLDGYYNSDLTSFTTNESHSDECIYDNVWSTSCPTVIQSRNQQAVGIHVTKLQVTVMENSETATIFDFIKGGDLTCEKLIINHPRAIILQVDAFSPNNCDYDINFRYDTPTAVTNSLVFFKYNGSYSGDRSFMKWRYRLRGHIADQPPTVYDSTVTMQPNGVALDNLLVDVLWNDTATNIKVSGVDTYAWKRLGEGPWWKLVPLAQASASVVTQQINFSHSVFDPADAQNYVFGTDINQAPSTTAGARPFVFMKAGLITKAWIRKGHFGTVGSTENSTISIRVNGTTSYVISSAIQYNESLGTFSTLQNNALNSGSGIPIAAGDYIELLWATPTWTTNPTVVLNHVFLEFQPY